MAKLFLTKEQISVERLYKVLSERLPSEYAVFVRGNSDGVKVGKDALMAIIVEAHPKEGGTEFVTYYNPGSLVLAVPFMMLLLPIFLFVYLRGSLERYKLEDEVIDALRDKWPDLTELD